MYELNSTVDGVSIKRAWRQLAWSRVSANVWYLGFTSLLTDVSSEMITSILPIYLVLHLHMTPLAFGAIDGLYQGVAALVRTGSGVVSDRLRRYKSVAVVGYAVSAVSRLGLLLVGARWAPLAAVVTGDRMGKGIRTAPRDTLIALSTVPDRLATSFGVHRALDAAGAMIGPVVAFGMLLNLAASLANRGTMPVSYQAMRDAGRTAVTQANSTALPDPNLPWLIDRWAAPDWIPLANVFSVGDAVIAVGAVAIVLAGMGVSARRALAGDVRV